MIGIVDYGMGNLYSLSKALERLGYRYALVTEAAQLAHYDGLILPGVGAFGDAMRNIRAAGLVEPLRAYAASGRPLLGICLGMQLLFTTSEEHGTHQGLALLPGQVVRFAGSYKIPHMGWNRIEIEPTAHPVFRDLGPSDLWFYFVHSYHAVPEDRSIIAATATHGSTRVTAAVARDNVIATQFHPEKSQAAGQKLLGRFLAL